MDNMLTKKSTELKIPVPWGHIAAKAWGDPCSKPVIAIHGLQDNAGTFDRLIALLPSCFYYVCIDLPGHGMSSRFPKGSLINIMMYVESIHRVVDYLKLDTFYYIGHSMGGRLAPFYAALFPEKIRKIILLDSTAPASITPETYLEKFSKYTETVINVEDKLFDKEPPHYTYDEALSRLIKNRPFHITKEAAEVLMQRSLKKTEKGYCFTTDQRLKTMILNPITKEQYYTMLDDIKTNILLILTNRTYDAVTTGLFERAFGNKRKVDLKAVEIFENNCNFKMVLVDGDHDVHNNEPGKIAPWVAHWLVTQKSML